MIFEFFLFGLMFVALFGSFYYIRYTNDEYVRLNAIEITIMIVFIMLFTVWIADKHYEMKALKELVIVEETNKDG